MSAQPARRARARRAGATIADVATAAGVSLMTVSRVLNGKPNVLAPTREKVEQAIADLDYVPNIAARRLAGRKPCRIALLYGNPSAGYLSEFLLGGLAGCAEHAAELVVEQADDHGGGGALVRRLSAGRIDAVLLPPPLSEDAALLASLRAAALPVAQVATGHPTRDAISVAIDDAAAAKAITTYLIGLGHVRIGFIGGNPNQSSSASRRAGYEAALAEHGIRVAKPLIAAGDYGYRSGLAAAESLLSGRRPPTAIFASNDDMAAATVAVAHRRQLDVPADLSVVGFDDTAIATTVWPELTTVRQPIAEMARRAIGLLAARLVPGRPPGRTASPHLDLAFELIIRGSAGPRR